MKCEACWQQRLGGHAHARVRCTCKKGSQEDGKRKSPSSSSARALKYSQTNAAKLARKGKPKRPGRKRKRRKRHVVVPDPPRSYLFPTRKRPSVTAGDDWG